MADFWLIILGLFMISILVGKTEAVSVNKDAAIQAEISRFAQHVMSCRHVPGLSLGVVKDGEPYMAAGYGVTNFRVNEPVTENTKFFIGSCSKAFTVNTLAALIHEKGLSWDTRVKDIMGPEFEFDTSIKTEYATLRDLLAHKMGSYVYGAIWLLGLDQSHSRQEYCSRLKHVQSRFEFRRRFAYSNFMYLLASCVAERLEPGQTMESLMKSRLLDRLGMRDTNMLDNITSWTGYATPHVWDNDTGYVELDPNLVLAVHPAESSGGVASTATDMQKWLMMLLREGQAPDGSQILNQDIWRETVMHQFVSGGRNTPFVQPQFPFTEPVHTYGMAWYTSFYRGYRKFHHSGSVQGFNSLTTVYPDLGLGIFTNTNGPLVDARPVLEVLHYYIADLLTGKTPWLNDTTACTFPHPWLSPALHEAQYEEEAEMVMLRSMKTERKIPTNKKLDKNAARKEAHGRIDPSEHPNYVGQYGHPLFANISITSNVTSGDLEFRFGFLGYGRLMRNVGELFDVELFDPLHWVHHVGSTKGVYFPIVFTDQQGIDGPFNTIEAIAVEPNRPPLFVRGLWWEPPQGES